MLKEVEDASGELWPVKKHPQSVPWFGQEYEYCAVSLQADFVWSGTRGTGTEYVLHPETGELIDTQEFYDSKGLRMLDGHEWY